MSRRTRLACWLLAFACAGELAAQTPDDVSEARADEAPAWMLGWSPLAPRLEHGRQPPSPAPLLDLLGAPAPRVGLLWTSGSPAGLALVKDARGELALRGAGEAGGYRRPLDPTEAHVVQLSGMRWQPFGPGAVIGRVVADQTVVEEGPFTPAIGRYGSDPFVVTDTTSSPMRHIRARFEGGYGGRWRGWAGGFTAGLEVSDDRTDAARLPRLGRSSSQGVSAGLAREVLPGLTLSAYGGWVGGVETLRIIAVAPVVGIVYALHGYEDPEPEVFINRIFVRYVERDAYAAGVAAEGELAGARWALFGEKVDREHAHSRGRFESAAVHRWDANGWRLGGAVTGYPFGEAVQATAAVEYSLLSGDAFRADLDGSIFRASESLLTADLDVRYSTPLWVIGLRGMLNRDGRVRTDFLARVASDIVSWTPSGAIEVARRVGSATLVSLGYSAGYRAASSAVPDPEQMGPVYRRVVAPELSLYASQALPMATALTVRQGVSDGVALLIRGSGERLGAVGNPTLPLAPAGDRTLWSVSLTAVWER